MVVGTGAAVVVLASGRVAPPAEVTVPAYQPPVPEPFDAVKGRAVGQSGCLAAACHGAPAQDLLAGKIDATCWQASGSAWAAADPHAGAYSLLTDAPRRPVRVTAQQIMAKYAPGLKAEEDTRCLACHTNPSLAGEAKNADPPVLSLRTEGVSCEACHGNAGGWIREHTTWAGDRGPVYDKTGMTKLYDIGERAVNCVGCHVGAPADPGRGYAVRDMNHDMIAAGHPRLNFDFAEYLRRLPTHWLEKDRRADGNKPRVLNPAQAWLVGRYAHAEAACKLLADRAERSAKDDDRTPWPEFAEYNCATCHHDIPEPWRADAVRLKTRPAGSFTWQTIWPVADVKNTPPALFTTPAGRAPAPAKVIDTAKELAGQWGAVRQALGRDEGRAVASATSQFPKFIDGFPDWDTAGQMLHGLAALERTRRTGIDFAPAFDAVRRRNWEAARPALDRLLGAVPQRAKPK
jgi:hypothetical protein